MSTRDQNRFNEGIVQFLGALSRRVDDCFANISALGGGSTGVEYLMPGGRLSLTSGVPVTTADVTASATIYYTPWVTDSIALWSGSVWTPVTFPETSLALGTLTAGLGYDIFGYLSGGILALEILAWSTATARATGISIQGGRYCKTGDKSRLYLGSFYTTSTTQTEKSRAKCFVWNKYNKCLAALDVQNSTIHNYNVATVRAFNNDQANSDIEWFVGLIEDAITLSITGQLTRAASDGNPRISIAVNSTTAELGGYGIAVTSISGRDRGGSSAVIYPTLGYSFACIVEFSTAGVAPGTLFELGILDGLVMA